MALPTSGVGLAFDDKDDPFAGLNNAPMHVSGLDDVNDVMNRVATIDDEEDEDFGDFADSTMDSVFLPVHEKNTKNLEATIPLDASQDVEALTVGADMNTYHQHEQDEEEYDEFMEAQEDLTTSGHESSYGISGVSPDIHTADALVISASAIKFHDNPSLVQIPVDYAISHGNASVAALDEALPSAKAIDLVTSHTSAEASPTALNFNDGEDAWRDVGAATGYGAGATPTETADPDLNESDVVFGDPDRSVSVDYVSAPAEAASDQVPASTSNGSDSGSVHDEIGDFVSCPEIAKLSVESNETTNLDDFCDSGFGDFDAAPAASESRLDPTPANGKDRNQLGDFDDEAALDAPARLVVSNQFEPNNRQASIDDDNSDGIDGFGEFGAAAPAVPTDPSPASEALKPETANNDNFGDFGGGAVLEATKDPTFESDAPKDEDLQRIEDDFGHFGAAAPDATNDPTPPAAPDVIFRGDGTYEDDDEFGDFGAAAAVSPIAPSNDDFDDDDFGDFGSAPDAPQDEPPTASAATEIHEGGDNDDFGSFATFDGNDFASSTSVEVPAQPAEAPTFVDSVDPVVQRAQVLFPNLFAKYQDIIVDDKDRHEMNGQNSDSAYESFTIASILDEATSHMDSINQSPYTGLRVLLEDSAQMLCRKPTRLIVRDGARGPFWHLSYPTQGFQSLRKSRDHANSLSTRQRRTSSIEGYLPETDHGISTSLPVDARQPNDSKRSVALESSATAQSSVAFPSPSSFDAASRPDDTTESLPSDRAQAFLKRIPDISYMLSSELSLPTLDETAATEE